MTTNIGKAILAAIAAATLVVFAAAAQADEAVVRRLIDSKLPPGGKVESVRKTPYADLYEVSIGSADGPVIYYVDSAATVIIAGSVVARLYVHSCAPRLSPILPTTE